MATCANRDNYCSSNALNSNEPEHHDSCKRSECRRVLASSSSAARGRHASAVPQWSMPSRGAKLSRKEIRTLCFCRILFFLLIRFHVSVSGIAVRSLHSAVLLVQLFMLCKVSIASQSPQAAPIEPLETYSCKHQKHRTDNPKPVPQQQVSHEAVGLDRRAGRIRNVGARRAGHMFRGCDYGIFIRYDSEESFLCVEAAVLTTARVSCVITGFVIVFTKAPNLEPCPNFSSLDKRFLFRHTKVLDR